MLILTLVLQEIDHASRLDTWRETAEQTLRASGAEVGSCRILGDGEALDLELTHVDRRRALEAMRAATNGQPIDLCLQESEGRRKRLLVADMESTVIENEMLDELAQLVGAGEKVAAITARAMNGELDFREALRERVGLLAGLEATVLEQCREHVRIDSGSAVLVSTLRAAGIKTALVSGGFLSFAQPVADALGFDHAQANRLEIEEGRLTGRVIEPILDRDAKVQALDRLCDQYGLQRSDAVTIGDGANDLAMLGAAGLGVAYHGKPIVAEAAPQRINVGDLSTLLYFLGYPRESWRA